MAGLPPTVNYFKIFTDGFIDNFIVERKAGENIFQFSAVYEVDGVVFVWNGEKIFPFGIALESVTEGESLKIGLKGYRFFLNTDKHILYLGRKDENGYNLSGEVEELPIIVAKRVGNLFEVVLDGGWND